MTVLDTARPITYAFELLDWILEQAMSTGPKEIVSSVVIDVLNELISEIHARGFIPARGEPSVTMSETLRVLYQPGNVAKISAAVLEFMDDIITSTIFLDKEMELHEVIRQLVIAADLEAYITFEDVGSGIRIRGKKEVTAAYGVLIDVAVQKQVRWRSALRPWHPVYGWGEATSIEKPVKRARAKTARPATPSSSKANGQSISKKP